MEFDTDFKVIVRTNHGRMFETTICRQVECRYTERTEECNGYHFFEDVNETEFETKTDELKQDFISDNSNLEECEVMLYRQLAKNETVIAFVADLQKTA